jgi:hypothetical protein
MPDQQKNQIIEQVTLRKLAYVRTYLQSKGKAKGGTRDAVRISLSELADEDDSVINDLQALLGELDAWGDQRLKIAKFDLRDLKPFGTKKSVLNKIDQAGMKALLEGEIVTEPPADLTPMVINYVEDDDQRTLQLYAAKSRVVDVPDNSLPVLTDERYPGAIFKPYRREIQKAVDFAEINLTNGEALFSTTLLRSAGSYRAEFTELFEVFQPLIALGTAPAVVLYDAVKNIPRLSQKEVLVPGNDKRTSIGGRIAHRSHSLRSDLRLDPDIMKSERATASTDSVSCNCYWAALGKLVEPVHTHVYAPEAEISVMGQVREASVRHVLRRILEVN